MKYIMTNNTIVNQLIRHLKSFIKDFFKPLDPLLMRCVSGILLAYTLHILGLFIYRYLLLHKYILAAGQNDGESYILSQALGKVVHKHFSNIKIDVVETDGTDQNLEKLQNNDVQLATAQYNFYNPNASWFAWLIINSSNISSEIAIISLIASSLWALNIEFKKRRKDKADKYIEEVVHNSLLFSLIILKCMVQISK